MSSPSRFPSPPPARTTPGSGTNSAEYSEKVEAGEILDTTHLGIVYRARPEDDIDDEATWYKANPSLGVTIALDDFARELAEAKEVPVKLNNFKRLRLNIIARSSGKYFDLTRWDAAAEEITLRQLRNLPAFGGLDLASTEDLAALVFLVKAPSGLKLISRFWCPEENLIALEQSTHMPYRMWADAAT